MNSELKPCPFCGESAEVHHYTQSMRGDRVIRWVECDTCNARGPDSVSTLGLEAREQAAQKWNRRTEGGADE